MLPSSSVVTWATIGNAHRLRTARIAAPISFRVAEGFEHEQVDATLEERRGLLREVGLGLVDAGLAPRLDADAERTNRAGDIRVPPGAARELRAVHVDLGRAIGEPERRELDPVGAEGIRLDDIGAGSHVGVVHVGYQLGLGQVQLVERPVQEHAARVQHRAHRPVADQDAAFELFEKRRLAHDVHG